MMKNQLMLKFVLAIITTLRVHLFGRLIQTILWVCMERRSLISLKLLQMLWRGAKAWNLMRFLVLPMTTKNALHRFLSVILSSHPAQNASMITNVTITQLLFVTKTMTTASTVMKKKENVNQDVVMIKTVLERFLFAQDNIFVLLRVSLSSPRSL